jgi:hypothetical protein
LKSKLGENNNNSATTSSTSPSTLPDFGALAEALRSRLVQAIASDLAGAANELLFFPFMKNHGYGQFEVNFILESYFVV